MLYEAGGKAFLDGLSWTSGDFRALLVDSTYTPDFVNNSFQSDVPPSAIIATSELLTFKTSLRGIAGAGPLKFLTPEPSRTIQGVVFYHDTSGTLIYFGDATVASGLPMLTNTAVITATFPNGIFKL